MINREGLQKEVTWYESAIVNIELEMLLVEQAMETHSQKIDIYKLQCTLAAYIKRLRNLYFIERIYLAAPISSAWHAGRNSAHHHNQDPQTSSRRFFAVRSSLVVSGDP